MAEAPSYSINTALTPQQLPPNIAKQIGTLWLRRYRPNPGMAGVRAFKRGEWKGVLVWALRDDGKVLGWALRAKPDNKPIEVMTMVRAANRRQGIGDAMLDAAFRLGPKGHVLVYPHDPTASAFYAHRDRKWAKARIG